MASKKYTAAEWETINQTLETRLNLEAEPFGLPERREKSVVLGTFNIRKLGPVESRSEQAWQFLTRVCRHFDLLAVQEVQDELAG